MCVFFQGEVTIDIPENGIGFGSAVTLGGLLVRDAYTKSTHKSPFMYFVFS